MPSGKAKTGIEATPGEERFASLVPYLHHPIAKHADLFDLQFDDVAAIDPTVKLEPAARADRAGTDDVAGQDFIVLGQEFDHLLKLPVNGAGVTVAPQI